MGTTSDAAKEVPRKEMTVGLGSAAGWDTSTAVGQITGYCEGSVEDTARSVP
jgi:hypothetical protein